MKHKCLLILSALLIAPLFSQAEWIYAEYWPWIYNEDNGWEYAYTPSFWTCDLETGEYCLHGAENSTRAPESLDNVALYKDGYERS
jgi:hypothetical protein